MPAFQNAILLGLCMVFSGVTLFGQKQNNQWRFGINAGLNFNSGFPVNASGGQTQTQEGIASVADKTTGALLFYTDGLTIWNANNIPMGNGTGLLGGTPVAANPGNPLSSTSAAVIVPRPLTPNIYYVITIDQQDGANGLRYSVVDMTLNGGLGDVLAGQKNILLYNTSSEKLQVVPSADGCSYWLITHDNPGNTFIVFNISQAGINGTPVLSSVGSSQQSGLGHIKVNRQLNKIATGNSYFLDYKIELFDFNNATGQISNPLAWNYAFPYSGLAFFGVEFSPNGSKLYVSNFTRVLQYDISLTTPGLIQASGFNVTQASALTLPGALQLGPDDKIYVSSSPFAVINAPNNAGAACNLQENPVTGLTGSVKYGLPQWIYNLEKPLINNQVSYTNTCITNPIQFSVQNTTGITSILWNFGDPSTGAANTATGNIPTHIFSQTGQFTVTAIANYACYKDTVYQSINIINCVLPVSQCVLNTSASVDTLLCGGAASLAAYGTVPGSPISTINFDAGTLPAGWTCSQTPFWNNPCSPGGVNGTTHFWMGNGTAAPRNLTSASYNLSSCVNSGVSICFDMLFMPQGGSAPCEGPDLPNEGVFFQYSTNGGTTWNDLRYFAPNGGNDPLLINWNNWCFTLPIAALTANTRFRWYQAFSSDANSDHWGIDNVIVYCNDPSYNIVWQHDGYTTGAAGGINPTLVSPANSTTYTATMSNGTTFCTSSVTIAVRKPVVTVNAGSDVNICSGTCTQLNATAKVLNYPAQNRTYSRNQAGGFSGNPNNFAINVTGLSNPVLQPNSIASVCIPQLFYSGTGGGFTNYDIDDITLTLTCPSGQTITLVSANSTNSGFFTAWNGYTNTCFVTGGPSIVGQVPPTTGSWSPNQPFNNLAGCNANGVWSLGIIIPSGAIAGGSGIFYGWSITFNTPEVSYTPIPVWSPTTNMTNANTLIPTVCPPPNGYTLSVSDTAGCVTASDIVNVITTTCTTGITGIKIAGDTCNASSAITFQVLGTSSSPYFAWNFGDPASGVNNTVTITGASANPNPSHTFSAPGTYTICATFQEPGFPVSQICRTLKIGLCCNGLPTSGTTTINICASQLPYNWNGTPYNAAGTYSTTLVNAAGCDSIATLILNVKSVSTSTTTANICPAQLPYIWNGNVYNAAGTYNVSLINAAGCDSVATFILNVGSTSTSTTTANICTAQLPYSWNGNVYNVGGTYNVTLVGSAGCDSVATLILNVGANSTSTTTTNICPAQLPYTWNGNIYNGAGTYNVTLINTAGCDSVATLILNVGTNSTSTTTANICPAQLPYNWNGNVYNAGGTYNITLIGTSGCDSIATLILNVGATSTSTTAANICAAQLPYNWNGNIYNAGGTYNVTLIGSAGCDSVATLILNVGSNSTSTTTANICTAQLPYNWNGNIYNAGGTYNVTLIGSAGCDSVATLILNVGSTLTSATTANICSAQLPYNWNGNVYNAGGTYNVTLVGTSGCDSISTLILNVGSTSASTTTANICTAQLPYNWNGNVYNASGTFNVALINSAGCDSIATLILNVGSTSTSTTTANICPAQLPYNWNGNVYNAGGTYNVTLAGSAGCDSIATLILNVGSTSTSTTTANICTAQLPYNWNGNLYNAAGTFNVSLINAAGCDSIATLNLLLNDPCPTGIFGIKIFGDTCYVSSAIIFQTEGTSSSPYFSWNFGDPSSGANNTITITGASPNPNPSHIFTAPGIYTVCVSFQEPGFPVSQVCRTIKIGLCCNGLTTTSTTNANICPAQLPYAWNANVYNAAGTYNITLINAAGCDSIATLILNVGSATTSTTTANICPAQLPYNWNGNVYNAGGTYNVNLINAASCDSVATLILNVGSTSTSTTTANICPAQLPYSWNGNAYNAAGTFNVSLINTAGCDSIATLILNVRATSTSTTTANICPAQLPYNWNGNVYNVAGTYNVTLINASGCDSVAIMILNVGATSTSTTTANICTAQLPYNWNGNVYNAGGTYNVNLINAASCDSIATLILNVGSTSTSTTTANICTAQLPYNWNGNIYNAAGTYNVTLINATGCDSVATLILNVRSTSTSITTANICPAQLPYTWNGNVYNAAGTYNVSLINAAGCDSIATLILNVGATSTSITTANICTAQLPYNWIGNVYNAAGTYIVTLIGSAGCDSIATLILNVGSTSTSTTTANICPAQLPYTWNGNVYNAAGTYNTTLVNTSGCDSIAALVLSLRTLQPVPTLGTDKSLCPGDSLRLFPGVYKTYRWQDFSNRPAYTVVAPGNYSVIVTDSLGCVGQASVSIIYLPNCDDIYFPSAITPNGDGLNDAFGALGNLFAIKDFSLSIYNRYGELVFRSNNPFERWNGTFKGRKVDSSTFTWYSKYNFNGTGDQAKKGFVVIVR